MQRGDIEIRIRGARFADVTPEQLLEMVRSVMRIYPNTDLVSTRATAFVLRPRKPKPEAPCPTSSRTSNTADKSGVNATCCNCGSTLTHTNTPTVAEPG